MVDQVCSPTLDRNHETPEYLLDKDCSAVVFGPPIPARLMKMPLSAGVTSMRINGIIAAAWARRSDFTDNRPSLGPFGTAQPIALLATASRTGSASETASRSS
jgi:hypothetical protein